jgi:tetratricopeptide (TPR) repeat protein
MNIWSWIVTIVITFILGVIAAWFAGWIKPGAILSSIKWFCSKLIKFFKKKYTYIPILLVLLLIFIYKLCLQNIFFPQNKLVVALTNFHLVSGAETTDNNALISHLQDSLKVYKKDIELIDLLYPEVRDSTQARELGERVKAHIVIWGSMEKTSKEAEIIPHITIVQPLGKMKLEQRQPEPATNISIAELDQIAFRKRKAREITDVVLSILGLAKYRIEKYEESIEIFEKIQYKNAEIFFSIGNSYMFLPKSCFLRGVALGDSERYEKAIDNYKEGLQLKPNYAEAHNNLGWALKKLKRYPEAEKEYREALLINTNYAEAHNNLGALLFEIKRYEEAEMELREQLRINPDSSLAHYNLGVLLLELNRYEEAEKECREAIRINPDFAWAHNNLGFSLKNLKRYQEAEREYRMALCLNPDFTEAYSNLGALLYELKQYSESIKKCKKALRINSDYVLAYNNLGLSLEKLKKYEEAEKEYREAFRIDPDCALAHYNLGVLFKNLERYEEAEKESKEALQISPDFAEAHGNLAIVLMCLNRKEEAKKEFETARDLFRNQGKEEDAKEAEGFLKNL